MDHVWYPFTQMKEWDREGGLSIVRGDGNYLVDANGRRYLDGVSSLWVNVHGHNRREINDAIRGQLDQIAHSTLLGLTHPLAIELARRLVAIAPPGLNRVFYSDSGSTAVEIALKQAFQYCALTGQTQRRHFLHLVDAYHGDTLGAVGVGGIELFHRIFGPLIVAGIATPSPSSDGALEALARTLESRGHEIAAFVMEPLVQGAAGMLMHPPGFLAAAAELCRRHGVLLIADEVATGFGRTGTMFACEQEKVTPDFLCLAKGLTGGYLPLAATLTRESIYEAFLGERAEFKTFFHGHTYTGNPLACAASLASLDLFESDHVIERVATIAEVLRQQLAEHIAPLLQVVAIRQKGLMIGIELGAFHVEQFRGVAVCRAMRRHGVIVRNLGDVIVWMPPLSLQIDDAHLLARATRDAIVETCSDAPTS